jgi:hypothetical protein
MVELYLHYPIRFYSIVIDYMIKYRENVSYDFRWYVGSDLYAGYSWIIHTAMCFSCAIDRFETAFPFLLTRIRKQSNMTLL